MVPMNAPAAASPGEKVDWVNEPLHLPRPWLDLATELGRAITSPRAQILRRAIRLGLPLVAKQEQIGEQWVSSTLAQPPVALKTGRKPKSPANEQSQRLPGL
jgi:hypothetical protein